MGSRFTTHRQHEDHALVAASRSRRAASGLFRLLRDEHFQSASHRRVFAAMRASDEQGDSRAPYDPHEVRRQLGREGRDEDLELLDAVDAYDGSVPDVREIVQRLQYDLQRAEIWRSSFRELEEQIASGLGGPAELYARVTDLERDLRPLVSAGTSDAALAEFRAWRQKERRRVKTGIEVLDDLWVMGAVAAQQSTMVAPTSTGKSKLGGTLTDNYAAEGHRCGVFCMEVDRASTIAQFVTRRTRGEIPYEAVCFRLDDRALNQRIDEIVVEILRDVSFFPYPSREKWRSPRSSSGNRHMIDYCYQQVEDAGAEVCFFDLMANALPSQRPDDVQDALQYAREWDADFHAVYVHQVGKDGTGDRGAEGSLGDARGAAAWTNVVENVFYLRRFEQQEQVMDEPGETEEWIEIKCLKQRFGPAPWSVVGRFYGASGLITDWQLPEAADVVDVADTRRASRRKNR